MAVCWHQMYSSFLVMVSPRSEFFIVILIPSKNNSISIGSSNTFQVFFDQPIQVEPDEFYVASAILDGAELSYFGQEGMSEVSAGNVTFQFQCSSDSTNGTGVQGIRHIDNCIELAIHIFF